MHTPWSKNENLIKVLHQQLEEAKSHIKTLETKDTLAEALRSLETKISDNIYTKITEEQVLTKVIIKVIRELKKENIGLC